MSKNNYVEVQLSVWARLSEKGGTEYTDVNLSMEFLVKDFGVNN